MVPPYIEKPGETKITDFLPTNRVRELKIALVILAFIVICLLLMIGFIIYKQDRTIFAAMVAALLVIYCISYYLIKTQRYKQVFLITMFFILICIIGVCVFYLLHFQFLKILALVFTSFFVLLFIMGILSLTFQRKISTDKVK